MSILSTILNILNKKNFKKIAFRFANAMNNITRINIFNSDNNNIALYFSNNFLSSISHHHVIIIYSLMLGIIKTNSRMYLSKYPIKYLESVFVLTNFEITTLSTLTSQIITDFFLQHKTFLLLFLLFQISPLSYHRKNLCEESGLKSGNANISLTIL